MWNHYNGNPCILTDGLHIERGPWSLQHPRYKYFSVSTKAQHRHSHYKDQTVSCLSYPYNWNSVSKRWSSQWKSPQVAVAVCLHITWGARRSFSSVRVQLLNKPQNYSTGSRAGISRDITVCLLAWKSSTVVMQTHPIGCMWNNINHTQWHHERLMISLCILGNQFLFKLIPYFSAQNPLWILPVK